MTRLQWVMRVCLAGIGILFVIVIPGACATVEERWLTKEEDAAFRKNCEGRDCVVIPKATLMQLLQQMQGGRI